jgi:hypothetical protein
MTNTRSKASVKPLKDVKLATRLETNLQKKMFDEESEESDGETLYSEEASRDSDFSDANSSDLDFIDDSEAIDDHDIANMRRKLK